MNADINRDPDAGSYDFIVIGAGSAAAFLPTGFPADRKPGPAARSRRQRPLSLVHVPIGYLLLHGNPRTDWMMRTAAEPGLQRPQPPYPRGKLLGGCSSINGNDLYAWAGGRLRRLRPAGNPAGAGTMFCPIS